MAIPAGVSQQRSFVAALYELSKKSDGFDKILKFFQYGGRLMSWGITLRPQLARYGPAPVRL